MPAAHVGLWSNAHNSHVKYWEIIVENVSRERWSLAASQTAQITAEQVARLGNIIRNSALVPRTVDVPDGTSVFLVAGSFNPNPNVSAWGFMTAVKIRNHVDGVQN